MSESINQSDFNIITQSLLYFLEKKNNLFADETPLQKLGISPEIGRKKIIGWSGFPPEELVIFLDPERIKKAIEKTRNDIKKEKYLIPDIQIDGMSKEELANDGPAFHVNYHFSDTIFGRIIIASTSKGVCFLAFSDKTDKEALDKLKLRFPKATYQHQGDEFQSNALQLIGNKTNLSPTVKLHVKGTDFQIKTWKKLVQIPLGGLLSYGSMTDNPNYSHPLGAAVGANPVAYIIPCHRAVPATGKYGEYHWGAGRKAAIICWEGAQTKK